MGHDDDDGEPTRGLRTPTGAPTGSETPHWHRRTFLSVTGGLAAASMTSGITAASNGNGRQPDPLARTRLGSASGTTDTRSVRLQPRIPDPESLWQQSYEGERVFFGRTEETVIVYADGSLRAVDRFDGSTQWDQSNKMGSQGWFLIEDEILYAMDWARLQAIDVASGSVEWSASLDGEPSSALLTEDRVYVGDMGGDWYVYERATGTLEHTGSTDGGWVQVAGVRDGLVYVFAPENALVAYATDGWEPVWRLDDSIWRTVLDDDRLYAGAGGGTTYRVDPATGEVAWTYAADIPADLGALPSVRNDQLYVSAQGTTERLDPESGERMWQFSDSGMYVPFPEYVTSEAVVATMGGQVYGLDPETGSVQWEYNTPGFRTRLEPVENTVYVGAAGSIFALGTDGSEHWTVELEGPDGNYAAPQLDAEDGVILACNEGQLSAHAVNEPPTVSAQATVESLTVAEPVTFEATEIEDRESEAEALSFDWAFGDGATATGQTVEHRYEEPGSYTATVTVTDPLGASATASATVEIVPTPTPSPTPSPSPTATPTETAAPGFGAAAAIVGLSGVAAWLSRRLK